MTTSPAAQATSRIFGFATRVTVDSPDNNAVSSALGDLVEMMLDADGFVRLDITVGEVRAAALDVIVGYPDDSVVVGAALYEFFQLIAKASSVV